MLNGLLSVAAIAGPELLSQPILMALNNLTKDGQWRVRMTVIKLAAELAKLFGKEFYMKNLDSMFSTFLNDTAASVRETGIEKLQVHRLVYFMIVDSGA